MKFSVIISYYKNLENLKLIFLALENQSVKKFEVIVSEDDYNEETFVFLKEAKNSYTFIIKHTHQNEDLGFRKNKMLNKSVKVANGTFLIFIDGDCVPHKHFIKSYLNNFEEQAVLKGRRVMLSEKITTHLKMTLNLKTLNFLNILFSKSEKKKNGFYSPYFNLSYKSNKKWLIGCNWGISKKTLLMINGFDEDYVRAAVGEDNDVEWRLKCIKIKEKSVKNKAIVYHLYHKGKYSQEDLKFNKNVLKKKIEKNDFFCLNGLKKIN
ncbi:glycosyltransferase [uncultured Polaribacter sp.]|uniref:glycosyltransferase n=1 Tax=uncultured Polaribacter sp. TaxID=174711 RepID=UPI00260FE164|nr:glycosyltransferase [uncultured Polaribacter sp.]